jgi:hypothetical protein
MIAAVIVFSFVENGKFSNVIYTIPCGVARGTRKAERFRKPSRAPQKAIVARGSHNMLTLTACHALDCFSFVKVIVPNRGDDDG